MPKKKAILLAAQETFGEHGYAGTTMKMVAERADVGFGLVAHYFQNKENLFMTAGFEMINTMLETIAPDLDTAKTGLDAVSTFVKSYLQFTLNNRKTFAILIRCSPFSDDNPTLDRKRIAAKFKELIQTIQKAIQRGIDDTSIIELPAEETAFMIYANIVGAVRTVFLTPYELPGLYGETHNFIIRSIARRAPR